MSTPTRRVAVAIDPSADGATVDRLFAPGGAISVAAVLPARAERVPDIDDRHVSALLCLCAVPGDAMLDFVRAASQARPWLPVVVACRADAGDAVRAVLAAGAADVIALPDDPNADFAAAQQLAFVLEKVIALRGATAVAPSAPRGDVVTVLGPKGGTGKTLTTCNLAVALAQAGRRVVVVDLDLQFGDVGLSFGLEPERTIHDLVSTGAAIDPEMLEDYLTPHPTGVRTLLAPVRPDQADSVSADAVRDILVQARLISDVVIVDTPPGFTPAVIAAIDSSSALCVVSMLDSLSLKNTRLALDTLELMGYPDDAMQLVLNRADSQVGVLPRDVEALIGRWPDVLVPSDRSITRAVNEGTPIVAADPASEAAKAFVKLSRAYGRSDTDEQPVHAARVSARRLRAPRLRRRSLRPAVS